MRHNPHCHKHPDVELVCPACVGAKGGTAKSKAKLAANRKNSELAGRPRLYPKCKRYKSHVFSPATGKCPCGFKRPAKRNARA